MAASRKTRPGGDGDTVASRIGVDNVVAALLTTPIAAMATVTNLRELGTILIVTEQCDRLLDGHGTSRATV
jgi:hypothetical protein